MHTYLLSDDDVHRYARDFAERLNSMGANAPVIWFALGISGDKMIAALQDLVEPNLLDKVEVTQIAFDRSNREIIFRNDHKLPDVSGKTVLVVDSAVHSGLSLRRAIEELNRAGAKSVFSYSLVVKKTAELVPSFFGLLIDEHDRAFFQLKKIPNNRLHTKSQLEKGENCGALRQIREDDVHRSPDFLDVEVPSIRKMTFGDLYYGARTQNLRVYLYEVCNQIVGFVAFKQKNGALFIDTIATDRQARGTGVGGMLMRWAESYARASKCSSIELWAIADRITFYERFGYGNSSDVILDLGSNEKYQRMVKPILYNIKPRELAEHV